jgi:hypothetical protein
MHRHAPSEGEKMKKLIAALAAAGMLVVFSGTAGAASGTFKDGGYSSTSADSGTCGPNWAQDLYVRNFTVTLPGTGGTFSVVEKFAHGHFSTIAGVSPGSCGASDNNTVKGGVQGTFKGFYDLTVTGTFDPNGACVLTPKDPTDPSNTQCTTAGWVQGFFGNTASYTLNDWGFTYNASHSLPLHHWVNAQAGNTGDIASALA